MLVYEILILVMFIVVHLPFMFRLSKTRAVRSTTFFPMVYLCSLSTMILMLSIIRNRLSIVEIIIISVLLLIAASITLFRIFAKQRIASFWVAASIEKTDFEYAVQTIAAEFGMPQDSITLKEDDQFDFVKGAEFKRWRKSDYKAALNRINTFILSKRVSDINSEKCD
jgi:hypothetical protein